MSKKKYKLKDSHFKNFLVIMTTWNQWRNRRGGGVDRGRVPHIDFPSGYFWRLMGKNEARKKEKKWKM